MQRTNREVPSQAPPALRTLPLPEEVGKSSWLRPYIYAAFQFDAAYHPLTLASLNPEPIQKIIRTLFVTQAVFFQTYLFFFAMISLTTFCATSDSARPLFMLACCMRRYASSSEIW